MTLTEFAELLGTLNIPSRYGYFDAKQPVPYIVYMETLRNAIYADGVVVYAEPVITLQLITKHRDIAAESVVVGLLCDNGISFDDPEFYFDDEQDVHVATFTFQIGG